MQISSPGCAVERGSERRAWPLQLVSSHSEGGLPPYVSPQRHQLLPHTRTPPCKQPPRQSRRRQWHG
eukprot:9681922-Prorocentrum_lima.AAC.1